MNDSVFSLCKGIHSIRSPVFISASISRLCDRSEDERSEDESCFCLFLLHVSWNRFISRCIYSASLYLHFSPRKETLFSCSCFLWLFSKLSHKVARGGRFNVVGRSTLDSKNSGLDSGKNPDLAFLRGVLFFFQPASGGKVQRPGPPRPNRN